MSSSTQDREITMLRLFLSCFCTQSASSVQDVGAPAASPQPNADHTDASPADATRSAIEAEVARVRALPDAERAAIGKKYYDAEELFRALEAGDGQGTLVLRASWVMKQRGGRLPKRGDPRPVRTPLTTLRESTVAPLRGRPCL